MIEHGNPLAVFAANVPACMKPSVYLEPFRCHMEKREKRHLGSIFGLENLGVNLTKVAPSGASTLLHQHSEQDGFFYGVEGQATLVNDHGELHLVPNMCAGFLAGDVAHHLACRGTSMLSIWKSAIACLVTMACIPRRTFER